VAGRTELTAGAVMDDPTDHLVPPVAATERTGDAMIDIGRAFAYAGPPTWLNAAIERMTGCDVLATLVQPISGDWECIGRYGDTLGHVAACLGEMAIQVQIHAVEFGQHWSGNASEAAFLYFSDTAAALSRHAAVLQQADQRYTALALDVRQLSEQLQGLLHSIYDQATAALLEMAVGTDLVETGAGAVAGYCLAAVQIAGIHRTIARASAVIQAAAVAIDAGFAGLAGLLKDFGDLGGIPTAARAYQDPVVARSPCA